MTLAIGAILAILVTLLAFVAPKWALFLFWPVTWCYPTSLLYQTLPFNIRFDDVFVIWLSFVSLRALPPDVLASRSFKVALVWFLSITLGCVIGLLGSESYAVRAILRDIGKAMHVPAIAISTLTLIRNERDCRRLLIMIALAGAGSVTVGMVQVHRPELTAWWEIPRTGLGDEAMSEMNIADDSLDVRADGAVGGVVLATIGFSLALLGLRLALQEPATRRKLLYSAVSIIGVVGLGYTVTRGAMAGLAMALMYSLALQSKKGVALALMLLAGAVVVTQTDLVARTMQRIGGREGGAVLVGDAAEVRSKLWIQYLSEWSPHYFLFGRGFTAEFIRHKGAVHNTYIGALAYTGMFGVGVFIWLVVLMFRVPAQLLRADRHPLYVGLAEAQTCVLVAFLVNGVGAELFQAPQPILFTLFCLVEARWREIEAQRQLAPVVQAAFAPQPALRPLRGGYRPPPGAILAPGRRFGATRS